MIYPRVRIFRHYISKASLFLGMLELFLLFVLAHLLLSSQTSAQEAGRYVFSYFSLFVAVLSFTIFVSLGLYNRTIIANVQVMMIRMFIGVIIIGALTFGLIKGYSAIWPVSLYPPRHYFYLPSGILLGIAALLCTRILFLIVADLRMFRQQIVLVGAGRKASKLKQSVLGDQAYGFDIVAVIGFRDEASQMETDADMGRDDDGGEVIAEIVERSDADEIVIAADNARGLPVRALLNCKLNGIAVTDFLSFVERELGRAELDELDPNWLIFSDGFRAHLLQDAIRRVFDITVSTILVLFTLPIMIAVAIIIKLDSPGPIFYRQERVGRNGKPFTLVKFRSMRVDAEKADGPRWAAVNDDRITPIGSLIRKTRIDELPQVINVLRGEMSIIGPRPERPFFVETLCKAIPYYTERHRVKPGITGWAQINYPYGASIQDAKEKLSYDLYYVKNSSIFLDMIILLQTVRVVLWPTGVR